MSTIKTGGVTPDYNAAFMEFMNKFTMGEIPGDFGTAFKEFNDSFEKSKADTELPKTPEDNIDDTSKGGATPYTPQAIVELKYIDPDTGDLDNDFITSDTKPTFWMEVTEGTLAPGDKIVISFDMGITWTDVTANYDAAKGMYYYEPSTPLEHKVYSVTVAVSDSEGIIGTTFGQLVEIVDEPTNVVTIDSFYDNVGSSQGHFASGTWTDDRTIRLEGTVSEELKAGEKLVIFNGTTRVGEATVDASGNWTFDVPGVLRNWATHTYHAVIENNAGSFGPKSNDFDVFIDVTISIDTLTTEDHTPTLTGKMGFELLPGEFVTISVNNKSYSSANGEVVLDHATNSWSLTIPNSDALAAGTYDVVALLHKGDGTLVTVDNTMNELVVKDTDIVISGGVASDDEKATAISLGEDGQWKIFTNGSVMDQKASSGSTFGNFEITTLKAQDVGHPGWATPIGRGTQNGSWIDINRDGLMDFVASDGTATTGQQIYINQGNNQYLSYQVGGRTPNSVDYNPGANVLSQFGGVIGFDKVGDGYVDIVYGAANPGKSGSVTTHTWCGYQATWDSQFVMNINGSLRTMVKDKNFTYSKTGPGWCDASSNWYNAQPGLELSGVDLNNDGTVDVVFHALNGISKIGNYFGNVSQDPYRLVVASNNGNGSYTSKQIINGVFQNGTQVDVSNGISMTWADFNGDGYMDLFMGRGSANGSHSADESRILFNDGHGNLSSTAPNGIGTASNIHWMGDNLQGGPSLAVDWNGDGKMDIIELPGYGTGNGMTAAGNTGAINLYTNNTLNGQVAFDTTNLLGNGNTIGAWGNVNNAGGAKADPVTGAVIADIDWDGDQDLVVFTSQGKTHTVTNTNDVAHGTALHFRIVDSEGINSLFGNTVQLFDSSGKLVASQIINAQSGNQTNNSTGIVDFYGLDPNETYSVALLRNINGQSADIGGLSVMNGNTIENVNHAWTGIKAGAPNEAHVLTAESDTSYVNTKARGIVGTGYNDTFYAGKGTDSYDGAGGKGLDNEWSATGGRDIIDFKLAGTQSISVNLATENYQNTGYNTVKLVNIEGVSGGDGNDFFMDNAGDNIFNGRGGNDVFSLGNGGHDTLVYELNSMNDNSGGNGMDTVYGFTIGDVETNSNADIIDLSGLLIGYDANTSDINDYLSIVQVGNSTLLHVDIDGAGSQFYSAAILNMVNVGNLDLDTLIQNNQIIV